MDKETLSGACGEGLEIRFWLFQKGEKIGQRRNFGKNSLLNEFPGMIPGSSPLLSQGRNFCQIMSALSSEAPSDSSQQPQVRLTSDGLPAATPGNGCIERITGCLIFLHPLPYLSKKFSKTDPGSLKGKSKFSVIDVHIPFQTAQLGKGISQDFKHRNGYAALPFFRTGKLSSGGEKREDHRI